MLDYTGVKRPETYYPAGHIIGSVDMEKKYTIEFIRNPKDWKRFCEEKVEWWDVCETITYEDMQITESKSVIHPCDGHAMSTYMTLFFDKTVYLVKMFEEIIYKGEMIQERYFEPTGIFRHDLAIKLNKDLLNTKEMVSDENKELKKQNELYKDFVKKIRQEKLFNEYRQEVEYAI